MDPKELKLEGTKEVIRGMVKIIDEINGEGCGFKYQVDLSTEPGNISITCEKPECFFALGIASHELLRKAFTIV